MEQKPVQDWRTLTTSQRIAARIKPEMDEAEIEEIVNQEYNQENALEAMNKRIDDAPTASIWYWWTDVPNSEHERTTYRMIIRDGEKVINCDLQVHANGRIIAVPYSPPDYDYTDYDHDEDEEDEEDYTDYDVEDQDNYEREEEEE